MKKAASISGAKPFVRGTTELVSRSDVFKDVPELVIAARQDIARSVTSALVMFTWRFGTRQKGLVA